eukprot:9239843-Alexandrium_andersonii.AAC.1
MRACMCVHYADAEWLLLQLAAGKQPIPPHARIISIERHQRLSAASVIIGHWAVSEGCGGRLGSG